MTGSSVLAQFRVWLRENCPLIDKDDKFNANYIGATATEYTIRTAGDRHRYDITGKDSPTYNLTFEARLPFGAAVAANIDAADFFDRLASWLNVQNSIRNWPEIDGYMVNKMTASNAGLINQADAGTARYQLQISLEMEEL